VKPITFYLASLVKKIWMLFAFILVSMAVILSVVRYSLPYMDSHKYRLEEYIQQQYGADLTIGHISAAWKGVGPAMVLRDVQISTGQDSPIELKIDETQVELDFWASLLAWKIKSRKFNLSELELKLHTRLFQSDSESELPIVDALQSLFLEQLRRFSISDSRLVLTDGVRQQVLELQELQWQNEELTHRGEGQVRVQELAKNSASFALELYGDKDELNGTFYADALDLDVSPWAEQVIGSQLPLSESRMNFQFWADIQSSEVRSLQVEVKDSLFSWSGEQPLSSLVEEASFYAVPTEQGWFFAVDEFQFSLNQQAPLHFALQGSSNQGQVQVQVQDFQLEPLLPLAQVFVDKAGSDALAQLAPKARVSALSLNLDEHKHLALTAQLQDVQSHEWNNIPGFEQLELQVAWYDKKGKVSLNSSPAELDTKVLLGHNLSYQQLSANIFIDLTNKALISVPDFYLDSELVNFELAMQYRASDNWLSITNQIRPLAVSNAKKLFPTELMGKDTYAYLKKALVEGQVNSANLIWNGALDQFPYADNQGVFQAQVELEQAEFLFDPDWPALEQLQLSLLFENEALYMHSQSGKLMDVDVAQVDAVIPELAANSTLKINAIANADAQAVTQVMQSSELADSVGAALEQIQISNKLQATLALDIPLEGDDVIATGLVNFDHNSVYIPELDLNLEQLKGKLSFNNDKIKAQGLMAKLWQQELQFSLTGEDRDVGYQADIKLSGHWDTKPLIQTYYPSLSEYVSGIANWRGSLALTLPAQGFDYNFQLNSDLPQMASKLPAPFGKQSGTKMRLLLDSEGDELASTIRILLGDKVKFNGIYPHQEKKFSRAHLSLGNNDFVGMGAGFSISANVPYIEFDPWYQALSDLIAGLPEAEGGILEVPQRIFLNAGQFKLADQLLTNVEMVAKPTDSHWALMVNARQARAEVNLYHDWLNQGLEVKADFLQISQGHEEASVESFDPDFSSMPPLKLTCLQCSYEQYDLGQVQLLLSRADAGMQIDKLELQKNDHKVLASGHWYMADGDHSTRLEGVLESDDFGELLKGFDFDSGIRDSDGNLKFDLSWQKAPYDFNFASLNGELDWRLGDGYITELSDGGARLLSILSLESLIRKLRLDFRDVFAKGFFYDKMTGSFDLNKGYVATRDTVIDGAAAEISLQGHTNLNDKSLDYQVRVNPKVTSSLPVILAWMVNPGAAIAAFALDEVLTSAKVISNIEYSLSGTIDKPILTEKGRKSRDVQLPAKAQPKPAPSVETQFQEQING